MVDYPALMALLSIPRPNGSSAAQNTAHNLQYWLEQHGIPYQVHTFRLYPFFFECLGVWLLLSRTILAAAIWFQWGWWALPMAVLGVLGGTLDYAFNFPLVTWLGACPGRNLIVSLDPDLPKREIVFSAHYDTKTELLDHTQRMFFLKNLRLGIFLSLVLGFWGPLDGWLAAHQGISPVLVEGVRLTGLLLTLPVLFLAWGFGLHLVVGRLLNPSQGAVDNGAACAILLGLAHRLAQDPTLLGETRVTLALFTGEEVNMQGSRAYVKERDWSLPAAAVNLEVMAQDGDLLYWEQEGSVFRLLPTAEILNQAYVDAAKEITAQRPLPAGPVNSDGASFLLAGIPTTTIGSRDSELGLTGFHRPNDNLDRVVMDRLPQGVEILAALISRLEAII